MATTRHFPCGHWHKKPVVTPIVCGRVKETNYAFKTCDTAVCRIVRFTMTPFSRDGVYEYFPDGLDYDEYGQIFAQTYDVNSGKVYVGVGSVNDIAHTEASRIIILTDNPFVYTSEIILKTGAAPIYESIEAMCSYSEGGFVYVFAQTSSIGGGGKVYEIDTTTDTVTRTAIIADGDDPVTQRNCMWVDSARGYIFWSAKGGTVGGSYIVGFNLATMEIDKQSAQITSNYWGIAGCAYDKCVGILYITHPIGPTYYPTHYALTSLDVGTMSIIETIELDSPTIVFTDHLEITTSHIYLLGHVTATGNDRTIVTCTRSPLAQVNGFTIASGTPDDIWYADGFDIKLCDEDSALFVAGYGISAVDYSTVIVDLRYDISSGIPVLESEITEADPDEKEKGNHANLLTCGENFSTYTSATSVAVYDDEPQVWSMPKGQHY